MEEYDLLQCIDRGIEPFGSNLKHSIFWKMSILHNYSKQEVIQNPTILISVIRETLGDSSAAVEKSIVREIRNTFNLEREDSRDLAGAIEGAKRQIITIVSAAR
jgi:hypothetical protein